MDRTMPTERQREIAALVAQGLSNAEIAERLTLTVGTVGNHVGHILRRLGARDRVEIAVWAVKRGPYWPRRPQDKLGATIMRLGLTLVRPAWPPSPRSVGCPDRGSRRAPMEDGYLLTETTRRVLALSCRGLSVDDVAARLGLSREMVRAEIDRAIRALGASSKLEAIVKAARLGLIDPSDRG